MASLTLLVESARIVSLARVSLAWLGDLASPYPPVTGEASGGQSEGGVRLQYQRTDWWLCLAATLPSGASVTCRYLEPGHRLEATELFTAEDIDGQSLGVIHQSL